MTVDRKVIEGKSYVSEELFMEKIERISQLEAQLELSERFLDNETNKVNKMGEEIDALRSVLSEWDEDKNHFTQWMVAEELRHEREQWTVTAPLNTSASQPQISTGT